VFERKYKTTNPEKYTKVKKNILFIFILGGAADGDLIEVCGRKYLISKAVNVRVDLIFKHSALFKWLF